MPSPRSAYASLILLLMFSTLPSVVPRGLAQEQRLDRSRMIEGLADRNMDELLGHYIEQVRDRLDPTELVNLEIQQLLMTFRNADPTDLADWEQGKEALRQAVEKRIELIQNNADHRSLPIWQTDLAELLLFEQMARAGKQAEMFYEFGVPDGEQQEFFEDAAVTAYQMASQAYEGFVALQGLMGRQPEVRNELEETGVLFDMEQYHKARTPFFLAHAAYFLSLLPDEHPYYADIAAGKPNPAVPAQRKTIEQERARLVNDAFDLIEPFAKDESNPYGILRNAQALLGRVLIARGDFDRGMDTLDKVAQDGSLKQTPLNVIAKLGKAYGEAGKKDYIAALDEVVELETHPLIAQSPLYRVLLADASHRIMLLDIQGRPKQQQPQMLPAAYEPYLIMLDALGEAERQTLQSYLFKRWAKAIPAEADLNSYPPMVRLAVTELALAEGVNAMNAVKLGDQTQRSAVREHLERASAGGETLTGEDVADPIRARGSFALAWALAKQEEIAEDGQDVAVMLRVIGLMRQVADQMPEQPVAADAIAVAAMYSRMLHEEQLRQPIPGADAAYEAVAKTLFEKYGDTPTADEQRVYYAAVMLQDKGKFEEAAEMYGKVPFDSPDYFLAQRERLFCLESLWQAREPGSDREMASQDLRDATEALHREAQGVLDQSRDPTKLDEARRAQAVSKIILAGLATSAQNTDAALALLEGFEGKFENDPDYTPIAIERRIVALVEANRLEDAANEARKMMRDFPEQAAYIVSQVLTKLEVEVDGLSRRASQEVVTDRKNQLVKRRTERAAVAVKLSEVLLEWAQGQGFHEEQMLPYRLPVIKSLRLSGQADQAVERINPLSEQYPDNASVLVERAESLYAAGGDDNLRAARKVYIRLIRGFDEERGPVYWRSWLRALSIADQLQEGADKIPGRIKQLRGQVDPALGGPEFKPLFDQLEAKYEAQGSARGRVPRQAPAAAAPDLSLATAPHRDGAGKKAIVLSAVGFSVLLGIIIVGLRTVRHGRVPR